MTRPPPASTIQHRCRCRGGQCCSRTTDAIQPPPSEINLHATGWLADPGNARGSRLDDWDVELEQLQLRQAASQGGSVQPAVAVGGEWPRVPEQVPRRAEERGDVEGGGAKVGFRGWVGAAHPVTAAEAQQSMRSGDEGAGRATNNCRGAVSINGPLPVPTVGW